MSVERTTRGASLVGQGRALAAAVIILHLYLIYLSFHILYLYLGCVLTLLDR